MGLTGDNGPMIAPITNGHRVVLTGTGSFLPNAPVSTDRISEVLGPIDSAPADVQKFGARFARKFADRCGVDFRHYAVDPDTGRLTHTVTSLAEPACRNALDAAGLKPTDVDLLLLSSPLHDCGCPSTSAILQESLGIGPCVEMEIHANCSGLFKCVQIALDALRLGRYRTALVVYSQISSAYLRGSFFNQSKMTKTQAALRYILTDGAGAIVLQAAEPSSDEPLAGELLGTYVESVGFDRPPAMTAGGGVADLFNFGNLRDIFDHGAHHLDQDLALVSREAADYLFESVERHVAALGLPPESVAHLVASVPSVQQYEANTERFRALLPTVQAAAEFPFRHTGYCGGAAVLVALNDLIRSGRLLPGQTALIHAVESSKWMAGGFSLRA